MYLEFGCKITKKIWENHFFRAKFKNNLPNMTPFQKYCVLLPAVRNEKWKFEKLKELRIRGRIITMKNDLKILAVALEKKLGREHLQHEEKHRNNKLLHKVWEIMKGNLHSRHSTVWHCLPDSKAGLICRAHCTAPMTGWPTTAPENKEMQKGHPIVRSDALFLILIFNR